jgi:hypothetical protein
MQDFADEFALPSGRRAAVRLKPPVGRDLMRAERALRPGDGRTALSIALLAELVLVDGAPARYDDLIDFTLDDLDALFAAAGLASQNPTDSPPKPLSPDLSASASERES